MKTDTKIASRNFMEARYNRPLLIVIILLLLIIIWLLFTPSIPALPGQPPPRGPHLREVPDKQRSVTGFVVGYKHNPHLDINAMQIKTLHSGIITIDFRPHTAATVMKIGPTGQQVNVEYSLHPNDEVIGYQLTAIQNNRTGVRQVLKDLPPPPDIPNHNNENFKLDKPLLIIDSYGGIVALRKDDLLFHFKPGLVDDIAPMIKSCQHFDLMAVRRNNDLGFVNVKHDKVYIVLSITMDNKTFLVR